MIPSVKHKMAEKIKEALCITGNQRLSFGEVAYCGYIKDEEWYHKGVRCDLKVIEEVKLQCEEIIIKDVLATNNNDNDTET